jgi:hypothetical protein
MSLPLAHIGHVLIDLPLFGGPVILLAAALYVSSLKHRREERESRGGAPSAG